MGKQPSTHWSDSGVIAWDLATITAGGRSKIGLHQGNEWGIRLKRAQANKLIKIILSSTSAKRVIFHEKYFLGFLILSGWFGIVLEVS